MVLWISVNRKMAWGTVMFIEIQAYITPPKEDGKISTSKVTVEISKEAHFAKARASILSLLDNHPFFYWERFLENDSGFVMGVKSGIRTTEEALELYLTNLLKRISVLESANNNEAEVTYRIAYQ